MKQIVMDKSHTRPTQAALILEYIREYGSITQLQALTDLGCFRLASRISELVKRGYKFDVKFQPVKTRRGTTSHIAVYSFAKVGEL